MYIYSHIPTNFKGRKSLKTQLGNHLFLINFILLLSLYTFSSNCSIRKKEPHRMCEVRVMRLVCVCVYIYIYEIEFKLYY